MSLPALLGGLTSRPLDFAASVVFAAAHGLLVPLFIWRTCFDKSSFTLLRSAAGAFLVERTILFSLRAAVAFNGGESEGLTEYMQTMFGMGSLYMIQDIGRLLRCILVNSTYPSPSANPSLTKEDLQSDIVVEDRAPVLISPTVSNTDWSEKGIYINAAAQSDDGERALEDQPVRRSWFRTMDAALGITLLAALITGIWGNTALLHQKEDSAKVAINQDVRAWRFR